MFDKLIQQIRIGEPAAAADLYHTFAPGLRLFLQRSTRLGDVEDLVYATLLETTRKIRNSGAFVSASLTGSIRAIAKSRAAFAVPEPDQDLAIENPAAAAALVEVLETSTLLEREILLRHYFLYESEERIAAQLHVPIEELRATRQTARARFRELLLHRTDRSRHASASFS